MVVKRASRFLHRYNTIILYMGFILSYYRGGRHTTLYYYYYCDDSAKRPRGKYYNLYEHEIQPSWRDTHCTCNYIIYVSIKNNYSNEPLGVIPRMTKLLTRPRGRCFNKTYISYYTILGINYVRKIIGEISSITINFHFNNIKFRRRLVCPHIDIFLDFMTTHSST